MVKAMKITRILVPALAAAALTLSTAPVISATAMPGAPAPTTVADVTVSARAAASSIKVSAPATVKNGSKIVVTGKVATKDKKVRVVTLSQKKGTSWKKIEKKAASKKGTFKFVVAAGDRSATRSFQVSTPKIKVGPKTLKAAAKTFTVTVVRPADTSLGAIAWSQPRVVVGDEAVIVGTGRVGGIEPDNRDIVVEQQTLDGVWVPVDDEFYTEDNGTFTVEVPADRHFLDMPTRVKVLPGYETDDVAVYSEPTPLTAALPYAGVGNPAAWGEHAGGRARWDACKPLRYSVNYDALEGTAEDTLTAAIDEFSTLTGIEFEEVGSTAETAKSSTPGAEWFPGTPNADLVIQAHMGVDIRDANAANIVRTTPGRDVHGPTRIVTRANILVNLGAANPRMNVIKALAESIGVGRTIADPTQMQFASPAAGAGFVTPTAQNPGAGDLTALRRTSWQTGCVQIG